MESTSDESRLGGRARWRAVVVASALATAAVVAGVAVVAGGGDDPGPSDRAAGPVVTSGTADPAPAPDSPLRLREFPLDRGWAETYGPGAVDGPSAGSGGISMPEGHCEEEVLFASAYDAKLSTYVIEGESSLTRQILRYADADAARTAYDALRRAVDECSTFPDAYTDQVAYAAETYDRLDRANADAGTTTFTFSYTTSDAAPFGIVYQFALVDELLYGSNEYGEWTAESARPGAARLDETNRPLVTLMPRIEG